MSQASIDAYQRGKRDQQWGYARSANPYSTTQKTLRNAWFKGYDNGKKKLRN